MEFHSLADIFPMMDAKRFAALRADIGENGLREPITIAEGKIADGRNRYNACVELGIEPRYEDWDGAGDLLAFIVSMNLTRRHLNTSQRAMIAAKIANMPAHRPDKNSANLHTSIPDASELLNVGVRSVKSAKKVIKDGIPELQEAVEVSDEIDKKRVSVSVAAKVAGWEEEKQQQFLTKIAEGTSASKAKQEIVHESKRAQPFPTGRYQVIYADPPWQYDNSGFDESAESQYPTMSTDDICAQPIDSLTTDEGVLFLWATNPLLPDALKVMKTWGFDYKTNMAWVKDKARGKAWWLKSKHELLLIGVRKNTPQPATTPPSAFEADRGPIHSRKPAEAYEIIESMYPGSKIELFSRNEREGWTMWGNEDATA